MVGASMIGATITLSNKPSGGGGGGGGARSLGAAGAETTTAVIAVSAASSEAALSAGMPSEANLTFFDGAAPETVDSASAAPFATN